MTKRRQHVEQLPGRFQTQYRKKQFASTVDQVFQPGNTESLTGYIGRKPSYYDATTDLYIAEPDALRQAHQLEPAMVSRDAQGTVTDILSYDDFINYLDQNNGNTSDHNRLFSNPFYTWAPPVDIDKLNNHTSYFWFGDNPALLPVLTLTSAPLAYLGDAHTTVYQVPPRLAGLTIAQDDIRVVVNGALSTRWTISSDAQITFAVAPVSGATILVYRYGDLSRFVAGKTQADPSLFSTQGVTALTSGMHIAFADALAAAGEARDYWVEGVGTTIELVPFSGAPTPLTVLPNYSTIDRRSIDGNLWSRSNYWVHLDAFAWAGTLFPDRIAGRPIIEFVADLELFNYGTRRVVDITCTVSGNPLFSPDTTVRELNEFISDYDYVAWDQQPYQSSAILEIPVAEINAGLPGSIYVDTHHALQYGDSLLVVNNPTSPYNNCILTIDRVIDPTTQVQTLAAIITHTPKPGDIVMMPVQGLVAWDEVLNGFDTNPYEYSASAVEYHFDGTSWVHAQPFRVNVDPLFNLYDENGIAQTSAKNSTFTGNRIFGYGVGTGVTDSVLLRPLAYDNRGDVVFSNDLFNTRASTATIGFQYYRINAASGATLGNGWQLSSLPNDQTVDAGIWSIPAALSANPDNEQIDTTSKPEWFAQMAQIVSNQSGIAGHVYGPNTYRDTAKDRGFANCIVQNTSPLLKAMLLASDARFDLFAAARFADSEYARFRRKFFQQITTVSQAGTCTTQDVAQVWAKTILNSLRLTKVSDSPFAGSSMAGGTYFIPPTPASMGLMPCVAPQIVIDDTYSQPVTMIVGHDGSRVPASNDYHDSVLLALEQMIYDAIPAHFKDGSKLAFDFAHYVAGWSRPFDATLNYSPDELASILSPYFIKWAQINNFDYASNTGYVATDPFTWNYRGVVDAFGNTAPGNWRALYRFYFDTDHPHTAPWELLGFATKPVWFDGEYGAAPYTSGNTHLWDDLRDGLIRLGPRAGTDTDYARPNLYAILPVDEGGSLLDPMSIGLITRVPTTKQATANWQIGDHGPVENLWINSPSYGFARSQAASLMRPAEWVETGWATQGTVTRNGQRIDVLTHDRPHARQLIVHGETVATVVQRKLGLQQWISDLLASQGQKSVELGNAVRGIQVQLAHKMAGFTQRNNLRFRAETIGVLPSEDVEVVFYEPAPFRSSTYSNIIVEWVGTGWSVVGYDNLNNIFNTLAGDSRGTKTTIALGANPAIYNWISGVAYPAGRIVDYKGNLYTCLTAHTAGRSFQNAFWSLTGNVTRYPQVQVYDRSDNRLVQVPYGTIFSTAEDVALFIRDYFRWLEAEGWVFDALDSSTGQVQSWNMLIRQFLEWTQITYVPGNFIALAPGASHLKFVADHGQAYTLTGAVNGAYGIVNRQGRPMPTRNVVVTRDGGTTEITTQSNDLAGARISLGEIEHIVLFSNTTVFNDLIYQPLYNIRQERLYMIGNRVLGWTGRRDAAGYILVDNDLLPSFVKAEDNLRHAFEIEGSEDPTLRTYARHLIGYDSRPYLDNLLVDETEQFEFYQGMIQEKGTVSSFSRLTRSRFIEQQADIAFLEEWAFRLGTYGATTKDTTFAFQLRREDIKNNPQRIDFGVAQSTSSPIISLAASDTRWITPPPSASVFPYSTNTPAVQNGFGVPRFEFNPFDNQTSSADYNRPAFSNAGYVRVDETDMQAFRLSLLQTLYDQAKSTTSYIQIGSRIWVYDRGDGNFDVLTPFYAGANQNILARIQTITEDSTIPVGYARVVFSNPHLLGASDVGLFVVFAGLTGTTPDMEGVTTIVRVDTTTSMIVKSSALSGYDYTTAGLLGYNAPTFYVLRSMHFPDRSTAQSFWSRFVPNDQQLIYVDDAGTGTWAVYKWTNAQAIWTIVREQPAKLDTARLARPVLYGMGNQYTSNQIIPKPVLLDAITVLDPIAGLLPGEAMRELSYVLDYDPAVYDASLANFWGLPQVGQLWWDMSSVRYLVTETDTLFVHDDPNRTTAELQYRTDHWGAAAPGSIFAVYEWTRSLEYPTAYTGNGALLNAVTPSFIASEEYDPVAGQTVIAYYFWVAGQTVVPNIESRTISALDTATILANPRTNDLPWVAPIAPNSFLLCNVEQFVSDDGSAFELSTRDTSITGIKHAEWQIMRKNDGISTAPEALWKALRQSLVGFDDQWRPIPSPNLQASYQVGYGDGRSLFTKGRPGILAARKTFVQTVNAILARNPHVLTDPRLAATLTASSATFKTLDWRLADTRASYVVPPNGAYTAQVTGFKARDGILREALFEYIRGCALWEAATWETLPWEADYQTTILKKTSMRLLVKNPNGDTPSWSVWTINPAHALDSDNPDDWLQIAYNYDVAVPSYADMLTDTYPALTRILVQNDENASGFWTVWTYDPTSKYANASGFVLSSTQTFRTTDFWAFVDWYADGYSAERQPSVSYASLAARDQAEGVSPTNLLVQIDDIGNGTWAWTAFDGMVWNFVARQDATVALSDALYDPTLSVFGYTDSTLSRVETRDGSQELQALIDILRLSVLTAAELNEVWFSMLHFIHAQQDEIDWAFKTSFMSIDGFNEVLNQTPIAALDNTQNLIDYVNEIKPYRVKIRDFTRTVSPPIDVVTVHASDFDCPTYYDPNNNTWRQLSLGKAEDVAILQSTLPYADWYANYLKTSSDPSSPDYNPVRKLDIELIFDRVGPDNVLAAPPAPVTMTVYATWDVTVWEDIPWEGSRTVVVPTVPVAVPTNYAYDLTQYELIEPSIDGNVDSLSPFNIDGSSSGTDIIVSGGAARDKRAIPEELGLLFVDDAVSMTVYQEATVGASRQIERFSQKTDAQVVIDCVIVPADATSVFVFFDGVRAPASAYSVDRFNHLVTVTLPQPHPAVTMVHALGLGGITVISEQRSFQGDGTTRAFDLNRVPQGFVDILVGSTSIDPSQYTVSGSVVTFLSAPAANAGILILTRGFTSTGSQDVMTYALREEKTGAAVVTQSPVLSGTPFPMGSVHVFTIDQPTVIPFGPQHAGSIVEVNGKRLHHPFTRYGTFNADRRALPFTTVSNLAKLKIWVNTAPYQQLVQQVPLPQPLADWDTATWDSGMRWDNAPQTEATIGNGFVGKYDTVGWDDEYLWDVEGDITVYYDEIVTNNPALLGDVIITSYEVMDFDISGNKLTVFKNLKETDRLDITTYHNATYLGLQASSFSGSLDGVYEVPMTPGDAYLVAVNGLTKTRGLDYEVKSFPVGFDTLASDEDQFDGRPRTRQIIMTTALSGSDHLDVMGYTGRFASDEFLWHTASNRPSPQMMGSALQTPTPPPQPLGEWDTVPWENNIQAWDTPAPAADWTLVNTTAMSSKGLRDTFGMHGTWDMSTWRPADAGRLVSTFGPDDTSITIMLNPYGITPTLIQRNAFALPVKGATGVIWIEGERIEYRACTVSGNIATLTGLRRATHGTSIGSEQRVVRHFNGDGVTEVFVLPNAFAETVNAARTVEVYLYAKGQKTPQRYGVHYTAIAQDGAITVTFGMPPLLGKTVVLAQSYGSWHPAQTIVYTDNVGILVPAEE